MRLTEFLLLLELIIFITIFIPTMVAFITGAPWVPTPTARVKKMLELGEIKPGHKVYDLGCGDGRMVHLAAKLYNADAVGIELSPLVYGWARVRNFFLKSKSKLLLRDFRKLSYKDADVICFYLLPNVLKIIGPKLAQELKPGTKVISYAFAVEGWEPVYTEPKDPAKNLSRILVYEAPTSFPK
ncbi:hypothetical protein CO046_04705 [Candidatus Peregrinibacteria bacterium CG_4_9_14_0_2_um_filter_53_11]|nr:MAG: hypothetical protein CO046_04705 [Candidatus Peregrinibacteria bacterium CG_4_9_14_0_2_um_filter_53_11]